MLDHVLCADGTHLHFREGLAVLGDIALEGAVDDFLQEGDRLGRGDLVEGDADVADVRQVRIGTDINLVAVHSHHDGRVGDLGQQLLGLLFRERRLHGLFAGDGPDDAVGQPVGAERGVGGVLVGIFHDAPDKVLALVVGILEFGGVDGFAAPFGFIGVGGRRFGGAAEFVLALGFALLGPLVVFHVAAEPERVHGDAEAGVAQDFVGGGHAGSVDGLAFELGVDRADVGHLHIVLLEVLECIGRFDGASFVPPKDDGTGNDEDDAPQDALERAFHLASVGLPGGFLVCHSCLGYYSGIS